jgi:hypothetical protein
MSWKDVGVPMSFLLSTPTTTTATTTTSATTAPTPLTPVRTVDVNINTLQYKLGLTNIIPSNFSIVSTFTDVVSTSYTNYLMSINDEQGFNNMDISMNENYTISNQTTGQIKYISAKILMGNINDTSVSQTVIQNPIIFEQPLGKLDRLIFKIYFDDQTVTPAWLYVPSYLDVVEWNATFQIEEEIGYANVDAGWSEAPSIPIPDNPNLMPYIFYKKDKTDKDNQNNESAMNTIQNENIIDGTQDDSIRNRINKDNLFTISRNLS